MMKTAASPPSTPFLPRSAAIPTGIDSTNEEEFATEWPSRVRKSDAHWAVSKLLLCTPTKIRLKFL